MKVNTPEILIYEEMDGIPIYYKNYYKVLLDQASFYYFHMIRGQPKRLLLITPGNIKNKELFNLIRANILHLQNLFTSCNFIELTNNGLIGH